MQAQVVSQHSISPSDAQALATRNLGLLRSIEDTLEALQSDTKLIEAIAAGYQEIQERLEGRPEPIDVEGRFGATLEKSSIACAAIYRDAKARHQSACSDPLLRPDDGVADAYTEFLDAIHDLHDQVETLREWIATHDAVLEPSSSDVFDSVDDLFESLMSDK